MKTKLLVTILSLVSVVSFAQAQEDYNIETIERNISKSHDDEGKDAQEEYSDAMNEAYDTQNSPQINIYNANSNANKQKQEADAAADANAENDNRVDNKVVSDVAVDNNNEYVSRTSDIRNTRKNLEIGTEQKTLEKIEWSRIEDEKDRADRLFGNRLDKKYNDDYKKEEPKVIVVEKPVYVAPAHEEPAYVAPAKPYAKPAHQEVAATYEEEAKPSKNWFGEEAYVAPMIGSLSYSADNVRPDTAFGIAIGSRFDSNVSIEGSFLYGELEMDDYNLGGYNGLVGLKDVTQYGFGAAVKYNFTGMGRLSPFVGAIGTYTMRDYQEKRFGNGSAESTAFDAGLTLGADVKVAKNFSLGVEYRIMRNLSNDRDDDNGNSIQQASFHPQTVGKNMEPLEEVNQQMLLLNGKFSF